ncbi:DMT family transporter [uncultured Tessaracoccus sp.]|uniref:DMT family transporter n=1 Tax=uncultured Tessaracoccus sp. TaxID=905023 RepID=UPI0025F5C59B|nr:DMT family transporter [uncultured Tessaracoccus sp.]
MIWLAIVLQVCGSFLFAGGAMLQSLAVRSTFTDERPASENRLSLAGLFRLFLIPRWTLGLLCVLVGAGINFAALTFAPVAVVQPIGILAVIWSVLLAARIHRHRPNSRVWGAVGCTVVGLVGFTLLSTTYATGNHRAGLVPLLVTFGIVLGLSGLLGFVAPRVAPALKAMLWASIGAMFYGMSTGMLKATADLLLRYHAGLTDREVVAAVTMMLAGFVLGAWMIQQGYASGPAEITVATMTTVDPVVAVVFGLVVLGEGAAMSPWALLGMALLGALAVYGVALLSHHHPDAVREREQRSRERAEAALVTPGSPTP